MKAGEIVEKCQNHPNEALKKTKIPALGHKYSAWTVTKKRQQLRQEPEKETVQFVKSKTDRANCKT